MKYTTLGNTGIEVSRICVGCMSYGKASENFHQWTLGPEDTQAMVKHAIDLGVNFFDTANVYSFGTTKVPHFDAAVRSVDLELSTEEIAFLEEPYRAHEIVGALSEKDSNKI